MGGGSAPKAPPPPSPPPTETSMDVQQEADAIRKRQAKRRGRRSTVLQDQVNPAEATGANTVLG
mgnify:CR=1 FL=1